MIDPNFLLGFSAPTSFTFIYYILSKPQQFNIIFVIKHKVHSLNIAYRENAEISHLSSMLYETLL